MNNYDSHENNEDGNNKLVAYNNNDNDNNNDSDSRNKDNKTDKQICGRMHGQTDRHMDTFSSH